MRLLPLVKGVLWITRPLTGVTRLFFDSSREIRIEEIRKDQGHCNIATIPPGVDAADFELWEDDKPLGPSGTLHEAIRDLGGGRYHIGSRSVSFSTSDGSDAQRNQRIYVLRPKTWQESRLSR